MNYMKDSEIMEGLSKIKDSIFFHRKRFSKTMLKWITNHYRYMLIYLKYQEVEEPIAEIMTPYEAELAERLKTLKEEICKMKHTELFTEIAVLSCQAIEMELIKVNEEKE